MAHPLPRPKGRLTVRKSSILLVVCCLVLGPPACVADTKEEVAEAISDGSYWIMRGLPVALTLGGGETEERIGRRMLDAGVASQIATELLKELTHDDRPNDPTATDGFPSGHASGAWALAEAASVEDPSVRPYAYAFAAAVTWSRVETERHTGLQALAGAALGYAIGHASGRTNHGLLNGTFVREKRGSEGRAFVASPEPPTGWPPAPFAARPGRIARPLVPLWKTSW
jgi:hypothetical protein